jgi:hypothetical protein
MSWKSEWRRKVRQVIDSHSRIIHPTKPVVEIESNLPQKFSPQCQNSFYVSISEKTHAGMSILAVKINQAIPFSPLLPSPFLPAVTYH